MHPWNVSPKKAVEIQKRLAASVVTRGGPKEVRFVAGCDLAYDPRTKKCFAGVIVFHYPSLDRVEQSCVVDKVRFPYIPGLLSFREAPALLRAIGKLSHSPDLFLVDGQGIAHPRRIGIASHLGLWLGRPTIGVAKSVLIGTYKMPAAHQGSWTYLYHCKEMIGIVLRTRSGVQPVFVSPGHLIGLEAARDWVLRTAKGFRLPEPTRQADQYVEQMKNEKACVLPCFRK
ncbi:MAG: deoxyribonuclease V [Candidatus Omnitrophica bacterium]|nr:deoxyribonuclease V [Candidatus Omnitrophota bacterium]